MRIVWFDTHHVELSRGFQLRIMSRWVLMERIVYRCDVWIDKDFVLCELIGFGKLTVNENGCDVRNRRTNEQCGVVGWFGGGR